MTQTIEYVVKANATQATQAISGVEIALSKTETQANKAGVAIDKATKPTRNLGQAGLEASRAIEDLQYGIGGVVNNIPSLVMALGGGMGLTAAISLAAVGVNQLYKNFMSVPDATDAAATAAKTHMDSVIESVAEANKELESLVVGAARARISAQEAAVEEAKVATERLRSSFRDQFGINPLDMDAIGRVASQAQGGRDIWIERWNNQKQQMEKVRVAASDVMAAYKETTDAYNLAVEEQVLLSKYRAIEAERLAQAETDAAVDAANAITEAEERSAKEREKNDKKSYENRLNLIYDFHVAMLDEEDKALREVAEARKKDASKAKQDAADLENEIRKEMLKHEEKNNAAAEKLDRERTRELDRQARKRQQIREREAEHARRLHEQEVDYLTQMGTTAAAAIGIFAAQSAAGQEAAFQTLLETASVQAGGVIMLEGGKVMAAGISGMLTAPNPISAAQIVGGGALVAAGAAVQTGGPAVISSLMSMATGGGGKQSAAKDRGASPRGGSGGGGGSGGLNVYVSYGAGGPLPEDIAREIDKVVKSNDRRRGAA